MATFYVTTPIYYVNARPHLGHAYTTITADAQTRFQRAMGRDAFLLTGTDEHGDKIVQAAEKAGQSPQAYVDEISGLFRDMWPKLEINVSDFVRTTEERHRRVVREILQKVYDSGDIYFGEYGGHYCTGCERFLTDKEMVDGLCPDHKCPPEQVREENYFFRMSRYQEWLLHHIETHPDFIRPEQYRREVVSLLQSGALEDLCISRPKSRLSWGIELPFDPNFVCYVWFDALINYVSALDYPDGERFAAYWPAAQHLVAKDILKPHAVFWPTMLKAAGIEPFQNLNVHGYWLVRDTKMSKSLGNVAEPLELAGKYGVGAFRFFLLREMAFGNDAGFSEEMLVSRFNADLANDLGNLFSRSLSMTHKYFGGRVPDGRSELLEETREMVETSRNAMQNFQALFGGFQSSRALEALWEMVRGLNRYIDATAPWALYKQGREAELAEVLYTVLEGLRKTALHLLPVMPGTARTMLGQLGAAVDGEGGVLAGEAESWGGLAAGGETASSSNLFPRIDTGEGQAGTHPAVKVGTKGRSAAAQTKETPGSAGALKTSASAAADVEEIDFSAFQRIDLRVGRVVSARPHANADKLLVLTVDLGEAEPRQVVAGIAEHFVAEELIGRQVTVVANLAPRKLRGEISRGMILAVRDGSSLDLLGPRREVSAGSTVS